MGTKGFCQFEIIINVLVCSFRFSGIPMLWVYGHYIPPRAEKANWCSFSTVSNKSTPIGTLSYLINIYIKIGSKCSF